MTISSTNRKAGPFVGTGAVSEFPFDFVVLSDDDLLVVVSDTDGTETTLVLDSGYSVARNENQNASPGGEVTLAAPLPTGHLLIITSAMRALQPTDMTNQGGFYPAVVNTSLDRLTILVQQLEERSGRAVVTPITSEQTGQAYLDELIQQVGEQSAVVAAESVAETLNSFDSRLDSLEGSAMFLNNRGDWLTGTEYVYIAGVRRDVFRDPASGNVYATLITHTSSSIASDLAAVKIADMEALQVRVDLAASGAGAGAELVNGVDVQLASYSALRAYTGTKTRVYVTGVLAAARPDGISGVFVHRSTDASSADNGGTIIVDGLGRRWHRDGASTDMLSVKWFGAKGDNSAIDTPAFEAARAVLETDSAYRGGTLYIPKGVYLLDDELAFTSYAAGAIHNVYLKGDGGASTYLNFTTAPSGSDGISFNSGLHFGVSDLTISNAPRDGLSLVGGAIGSADFLAMGYVKNVRLQFCGRDGFRSENSFMISMEGVWSHTNTLNGFNFLGFHTSIDVRRSWASGNTANGWAINGCVYSSFSVLGADDNDRGYVISNCQGVDFNSCGSERAAKESFFLATSDASATGLPAEAQNISGVSFRSCYALQGNNSGAAGAYSTFVGAVTANSRPIDIYVSACKSYRKNVTDPAITANGASGAVTINEASPSYDGSVQVAGTVYWTGRKFSFTPVLKGSSSAGSGTYSLQRGEYTLRDGLCVYRIELVWSAHTGTGGLFIDGLPVTSVGGRNPSCLVDGDNVASTGVLGGYVESNSKIIRLTQTPIGGARSFITVDTAGSLWVNGEYEYA
jgi:hypothetical protein